MNYKLMLVFGFILSNLCSCSAQEKSNFHYPNERPKIIRNFPVVTLAPDFDSTLVSQYFRSIFQDSKGNMWFGSLEEGVVKYDQKTLTYYSYPEGFINKSVNAISEDKMGNIWFGTDNGVFKYDGTNFKNYGLKDGLDQLEISRRGILVSKSGIIWVGTHNGVYKYDSLVNPSFSKFPLLKNINVADIFEDKDGNIWFASSGQGVFKYDGIKILNINEKEGLGENYAGGIAQDKMGNMWFTMKNGICKFDGKIFTEFTPKDGLEGKEFWGILIEKSGIVWVTARGNTTRFDPSLSISDAKAFTIFKPENGLNCCVQSMYQDREGNVWWGTGQGLYRFDGKNFYQVKKEGPW